MMNKDVQTWFALVALLLGISLAGCGTEIGNGWKTGDETANEETRKSAASPQVDEDMASDMDSAGGADDGGDGDDDAFDEAEGGTANDVAAPNFSSDILYPKDILFVPCGSPFGNAPTDTDYTISSNGDVLYNMYWDENGWDVVFGETDIGEDPSRRVTPDADNAVTNEIYVGAKIAPWTATYSCEKVGESTSFDGPEGTVIEISMSITLDTVQYEVTWATIDNSLRSATVSSEGKPELVLTIETP